MVKFALHGKAVLITGANSGIGREMAMYLASQGADVAVHYLGCTERKPGVVHLVPGEAAALSVVSEIRRRGGKAVALEADLQQEQAAKSLVETAEAELGPLFGLVNNAAHCQLPDNLSEASWLTYRRHYDVNLGAPALLIGEFAQRARPASVVNISTDAAQVFPSQLFYGTSKAALEALTRAAAVDLGPLGIRVNAVAPGPVQTGWMSPDLVKRMEEEIPLGRVGNPEDIAQAVAFLLSDGATWITGQVLQVAGGHALR